MELEDFRKAYEAKDFGLPDFVYLEENFEMGKVDVDDLVLRSVRKTMMEKIISSLGFLEMLLNPMNASRMYHNFLNSLSVADTKKIEEMYSKLANLSVLSLEREIDYSEDEEAKLILKIKEVWEEVRPGFREILEKMKNPSESNKKVRNYFG